MKKIKLCVMIAVIGFATLLGGCFNKNKLINENENTLTTTDKNSQAYVFLEKLAPIIDKSAKDIQKSKLTDNTAINNLPGYTVKNDSIPAQNDIRNRLEQALDGRVNTNNADGPGESLTSYINDNLICSIRYVINYDIGEIQTIPFRYDEESDSLQEERDDETNEKLDKIFDESTYTVELTCAEFNEEQPSPLEFFFSMGGGKPFWDAELKRDKIDYDFPDFEDSDFIGDTAYINKYGKSGESLVFNARKYDKGNMVGEITKDKCRNDDKGDIHDYKVEITFAGNKYYGCADKVDNFLISGREGNFDTFIKKIGYTYNGNSDPKTMHYHDIETKDNLVSFVVSWETSEDDDYKDWEYFVIGKTENGWKTYRQGDYSPDNETCEKYAKVPGLMEFSVFDSCPKG